MSLQVEQILELHESDISALLIEGRQLCETHRTRGRLETYQLKRLKEINRLLDGGT